MKSTTVLDDVIEEIRLLDLKATLESFGISFVKNKAICPFHDEKTASFSVKDNRYKCFGCGESGDLIDFVMKYNNFNFMEAVELLAEREIRGEMLHLKETKTKQVEEKDVETKVRNLFPIKKIKADLHDYYKDKLWNTEEGKKAIRFLENERGFTLETIEKFEIGFAPRDSKKLLGDILKLGEEIEDLDLLVGEKILGKKDGKVYPFFYNRIIFPIKRNGQVIGFQGRAVGDNSIKYLTALKDIFIWNIDSVEENKEVEVFEGIPDALIYMQETGKTNVIALLGTNALGHKTEGRKVLTESNCNYKFYFDSDEAGKKAIENTALIFKDKAIFVIVDSDNKDINDIFLEDRNNFKEKIKEKEDSAVDYIDYMLRKFADKNDMEKMQDLEELLRVFLFYYENDMDKLRLVRKKIKKATDISLNVLDKSISGLEKELKEKTKIEKAKEMQKKNKFLQNCWLIEDGILYKKFFNDKTGELEKKYVTDTIPTVTKCYIDNDTKIQQLEISFVDKKNYTQTIVAPRVDFLLRKNIVNLLGNYGFSIKEKTSENVIDYLEYIEKGTKENVEVVTDRFGWHNDFKSFVIGNDVIGEKSIKFKASGDGERQKSERYVTQGSFENWKKIIPLVKDKKWVMFQIYQSFLSPLLPILETTNYIFSNYGETSQGKTLTNRIAASIWGSTNKDSKLGTVIINADGMTLDNLEKTLALHTHIPVFLDDAHKLRSNVKSAMAYMVENGQGKGRGTIGKGTQETRRIKTVCYTTSEAPLVSMGSSKNKGEQVRVIEMSGSPLREQNAELAIEIEKIVNKNFGHAGRKFIETLLKQKDFSKIIDSFEKIKESLIEKESGGMINRFRQLFAGPILAGILANDALNLGLDKNQIFKDVLDCLQEIQKEFDPRSYSEAAIDSVMDFVNGNRTKFVITPDENADYQHLFKNSAHYGVWHTEKKFVGVYRNVLEDYLKSQGIEISRCLKGWAEKGAIEIYQERVAVNAYNPLTKSSVKVIKFLLNKIETTGEIKIAIDGFTEVEENIDF